MNWLGALGGVGSLVGGISGLFGAGDAEKAAEQAAEASITQFQQSAANQQSQALAGGQTGLYGLTGTLRDALGRMGGGLGSGLARAGVWNSSAAAGALSNAEATDSQQVSSYATDLANRISQMKFQADQQASQMQLGLANSNLNYARQQAADSEKGIASGLGALGQFGLSMTGQPNANSLYPGSTGSVLPQIPGQLWEMGPNGRYQPQSAMTGSQPIMGGQANYQS